MGLLSKIGRAIASTPAAKSVEHAGKSAASAVEHDAFQAAKSAAEQALQKKFGPQIVETAQLPAYDTLPADQLAAAQTRSQGLTTPQQCIRGTDGHHHEPVTLTVAGSQAQVEAALKKAGWTEAAPQNLKTDITAALSTLSTLPGISKFVNVGEADGSMSTMSLDGKAQVVGFEKNDDHHKGRDHLRVFATGQTSASGQPIWAIAATRDTSLKINTATLSGSHTIDHDIDPERDQVMADLLGTGDVATWNIAKGVRDPGDASAIRQTYTTDGNVYQVELK